MQVLQWSMTIPLEKQERFVDYFHKVLGPTFQKFGALKHELYKVGDAQIIRRQVVEENRFIERVFFDDDFHIPDNFARIKANPEAWKLSRNYEEKFDAKDIEFRVLFSTDK